MKSPTTAVFADTLVPVRSAGTRNQEVVSMPAAVVERSVTERAVEVLRRAGNPFRNYFARNPDDEVCARYHVADLFAREREQLLGVVDLYRYTPNLHSEVLPILGNKGSGKTHLLHSIKHGPEDAWQL